MGGVLARPVAFLRGVRGVFDLALAYMTPPATGAQRKVAAASAAASAVPAGKAGAPSSNTGLSQVGALVDFLAVSIALGSFRDPSGPVRFALPKNEDELRQAVGTVRFSNLAQTFFNSAFPGTCIEARPFDKKGFLGYHYSAALHVEGVEGQVGMMGVGGNGDTVHISLSGAGCVWLTQMKRHALTLEGLGASITRIDLAFDDLNGQFLDVKALALCAQKGLFDRSRRQPPLRRLLDDLGSGKGSTLYIGRKGSKELCVYEKGKQLGKRESRWVRAECRLWAKDRPIPYDALLCPGDYLRGEYPFLAELIPAGTAKRTSVVHAQSDATIEGVEKWLRNAAGKSLNFLQRSGIHPVQLVDTISRDGTPRRFAGIPEEVAFKRIEKKAGVLFDVFDLERMERPEPDYNY